MPTEKPRVTFTVDQNTLSRIDNYRFETKSRNQTQAILSLIEKGLAEYMSENPEYKVDTNPKYSFTVDEQTLINKYRALDTFGQDTVKAVLNCENQRCLSQKEMSDLLSDYNIIYLPVPIQPASAGTGEFADDETVERVPVLRNVWTSKADYALRVHGDSMEPDMHEDDFILVRAQPAVELGEIGIFIHDNERYVKVFRGDRLESLNDAYEDIPFSEDTRCIGKVIGVLKPEWIAK